jgi:hypothetical protein
MVSQVLNPFIEPDSQTSGNQLGDSLMNPIFLVALMVMSVALGGTAF